MIYGERHLLFKRHREESGVRKVVLDRFCHAVQAKLLQFRDRLVDHGVPPSFPVLK